MILKNNPKGNLLLLTLDVFVVVGLSIISVHLLVGNGGFNTFIAIYLACCAGSWLGVRIIEFYRFFCKVKWK